MRSQAISLIGIVWLLGGCAGSAPAVRTAPNISGTTATPATTVSAEQYAVGEWHLGKPIGAFAAAKPSLWATHRFDVGGQERAAMTIGSRSSAPDDPMHGAHLAFLGPAFARGESSESAFVPDQVIVLGNTALQLFEPELPPFLSQKSRADEVSFVVTKSMADEDPVLEEALKNPLTDASQKERMREELRSRPARPSTLRLECHASRVCVVTADDTSLGYVLGEVPRNPDDRFYKGLKRLVETHLHLR